MNSPSTFTFGDILDWTIGVDGGSSKVIKMDITVMGIHVTINSQTSAVAMKSMRMQEVTGKVKRSLGVWHPSSGKVQLRVALNHVRHSLVVDDLKAFNGVAGKLAKDGSLVVGV